LIKDIDETKRPLLEHLIELRKRLVWSLVALIICVVAAYAVSRDLFWFLQVPLYDAFQRAGYADARMIFTNPIEFFWTRIKLSLAVGLCVSFPFVGYQLWLFVAPGLYRREKLAALPFLVIGPLLFLLGASVVYYVFYPIALDFFLGFQEQAEPGALAIELETRVSEYYALLLTFVLAFGAAFQMPLIITLLARIGFVSADQLKGARKYAIVGAFVIAAVITPPDPFSQIGLALPLILLYEISIWCARIVERKRAKAEADAEASNAAPSGAAVATAGMAASGPPLDEFEETDFNQTR
jgi:sec-independent protein translocase protein TatC